MVVSRAFAPTCMQTTLACYDAERDVPEPLRVKESEHDTHDPATNAGGRRGRICGDNDPASRSNSLWRSTMTTPVAVRCSSRLRFQGMVGSRLQLENEALMDVRSAISASRSPRLRVAECLHKCACCRHA